MAEFGIGGGCRKPVDNAQHFRITLILALVQLQHLLITAFKARLVEDAQHLFQPVAGAYPQTRDLDNDAFMGQAIHERIRQSHCHQIPIVVERLAAHIEHRLFDITHLMAQQIYRHHRNGISPVPLFLHVVRIGILSTQILSEAQGLRGQPGLLEFNEHQVQRAILFTHLSTKVNTKHRESVTRNVGIFVASLLYLHDLFLQEGRKYGLRDAFVFKQILENDVVDGISNCSHHIYLCNSRPRGQNYE